MYPRVTAMVEKLIVAVEPRRRRVVLPGADRRRQGARRAALAPADRVGAAPSAPCSGPKRCSRTIAPSIIHLDVEEAELAKLFANTWRYIQFAAANQLFMIANDFGLDFARIRDALKQDYPRLAGMPGPGLAAGPCLLKDTMQLAAFNNNNFTLGHASMMINEGLPLYMVSKLEQQYDLSEMTVGILGMAFKAESDDTRSSLSYKLKRLLRFRAARVLCTDPYAQHRRRSLAARRRARRIRSARDRDTAPPVRRHRRSTSRSSTCGTCWATASACDTAGLGCHPRLQRG